MPEIRRLAQINEADLRRIASGYVSNSKYAVSYSDTDEATTFRLTLTRLEKPYVGRASEFDSETIERYERIVKAGWSYGAYDGEICIGIIIAEAQEWNKTVMVWEFHLAEPYRRKGIGRQLMQQVVEAAKQAGMRSVVCETQNTNAGAIKAYRRLGFGVEAIDISLYSNDDYPDKEVAVFMKRRL